MFDQDLSVAAEANHVPTDSSKVPITIFCTHLQPNDEFYLDEWVDYHIALGVTHVFLFNSAENEWIKQWRDEKRIQIRDRISILPFNASATTRTIFQDCSQHMLEYSPEAAQINMVPLNVHEFLVLNGRGTLADLLKQPLTSFFNGPTCALVLPIWPFGTSGEVLYDPLPVTKRFMHLIDGRKPSFKPIIMTSPILLVNLTNNPFFSVVPTDKWSSSLVLPDCPSRQITAERAAIYQYHRSIKECRMSHLTEDVLVNSSCSEPGTIYHDFAWMQLKQYLPRYSGYDKLYQ
jgi:hypothetical protein